MIKSILKICLWAMVFLMGASQVWSLDMEDRFLDDFGNSKDIFIDVKDVPLADVLKIISKQTNLNFIASQVVADKKITLYINKIPIDQALHMVLDANDLTYDMSDDNNVFVVKPKPDNGVTLITRVYQLKYATVSRSKLNNTIDTSSPSSSPTSSSNAGTGGSNNGPSNGNGGSGAKSGNAQGGLEEVIKNALSPVGKIVEDARSNSLIISDVPSQFDNIENAIAKLDVPIPQILIEVEMVDVSKSTGDQLGITYGATPLTFTGGSSFANWPFGHSTGSTSSGSSSSSSSTSSTNSTTTGWNANGMTAALNFLMTKTDARTLARPRILTLNNETAQIQISTDQAIDVLPTSSSAGGQTGVASYTVDRYTTGVILKVTPQADISSRDITMAVSPRVIDVVPSAIVPPTSNTIIYDPETRGSDSMLVLHDGQSMMIGGLLRTDTTKNITKLPILGDLPVIGAAFRSKTSSKSERELLIFITPHIIDNTNEAALQGGSTDQVLDSFSNRSKDVMGSLNDYESKNY